MIFDFIAVILLLFTDYGGLYYYNYASGNNYYIYYYIWLLSNFETGVFIGLVIMGFVVCIFQLNKIKRNLQDTISIKNGFLMTKVTAGIFDVCFIFFIIETISATSYCFDAGFFGGCKYCEYLCIQRT